MPGVALLIRPFLFPFLPFAARLPPGLSGAFFGNSFFFLLFFFLSFLSLASVSSYTCGMTFVTREMKWNTIKPTGHSAPNSQVRFFPANGCGEGNDA